MQETASQGQSTALANIHAAALASTKETSSTAMVAQAVAAIQARYQVALARPRNFDQVRVALLKECRRPFFAEVARYNKPIGKSGVEGPSIRFAEAAARCMGNILVESPTVYDDHEKRIVRVMATDLETNMTYLKDVTVTKTIERRKIADGQAVISTRVGSQGQTLYIIEADDDAILNKENALVSKAMRTVLLRLIPGDLVDEAMEQVTKTLRDKEAEDPDAARRRIVDGFSAIGVQPTDLVQYLGHDLGKTTPPELVKLRALYTAIRDGEATWAEAMESVTSAQGGETKTSKLTEILDAKRAKATTKPAEAIDESTGEIRAAPPAPVAAPANKEPAPPEVEEAETTEAHEGQLADLLRVLAMTATTAEIDMVTPYLEGLGASEKTRALTAIKAKREALWKASAKKKPARAREPGQEG